MYKRPHFKEIKKRLKEPKSFIQVIAGPRQVGKTTLIQQVIQEISIPSVYISADAIANTDTTWLDQQWQNARLKLQIQNHAELLFVIDEIQKVSNWSEIVKANWDKDKLNNTAIKVVLLGSSRLLIQQGLTESLTGRFETTYMGHWSFDEMYNAFNFSAEQFAWFGGYPGAVLLINDSVRWNDYILNSLIETTISKDILLMEQVNKPMLLRKLFELGCLYSGQILSFNKILGQLTDAGNTTTLSHYLLLLDNAGLLTGLEKFSKRNITQRSSSPKFQVQNAALVSALSDYTFENALINTEVWGRHVETAVGVHLLNASKTGNIKLTYWREGNNEVDFILQYQNKVIGLEIKSGKAKVTSGMKKFESRFSPHKIYLISENSLSWKELLKLNPLELF